MLSLPHRIDSKLAQDTKVYQTSDECRREREENTELVLSFQEPRNTKRLAAAGGSKCDYDRERGLEGEVGREYFGLES